MQKNGKMACYYRNSLPFHEKYFNFALTELRFRIRKQKSLHDVRHALLT